MTLVLALTAFTFLLVSGLCFAYSIGWHRGYGKAWQDVADATQQAERENHQWNR